jgi:hypothetical protein
MNPRTRPASDERGVVGRLAVLVSRAPVAVVAALSGLAIAVFVVLGIAQRVAYPLLDVANLDSEASIATGFSAALLWAASLCWLLVAVTAQPRLLAHRIWWPVLALLALDEGYAFHERLERWSGIDWQVLYLPILTVASLAWLGVLRRHWPQRDTRALLGAGAAAWGGALLLELIQNWGGSPVRAAIYDPAMITEEALEMIGSTTLLLAAILVLRRAANTGPDDDG